MTTTAQTRESHARTSDRKNVASLSRRLDRAALDQLRAVAAAQASLIETQQAQIASLQAALTDMEYEAEHWRQDALDVYAQLGEMTGQDVGLMCSGELTLVPAEQVPA